MFAERLEFDRVENHHVEMVWKGEFVKFRRNRPGLQIAKVSPKSKINVRVGRMTSFRAGTEKPDLGDFRMSTKDSGKQTGFTRG
jgi:hypothetical protein